jgi:glycosyltransferase involved in cell wall biosynthesis
MNKRVLDREAWHHPLVSIIVIHHNYSEHVEDALLSIVDQTHERWECVVVDDVSDDGHRARASEIVDSIGDSRIRFLPLSKNVGQIQAFFTGFDQTSGEFICLLDPDDRYEATFLDAMLRVHLSHVVFCPLAGCDQHLLRGGAIMTGTNSRFNMNLIESDVVPSDVPVRVTHTPAKRVGWHWTSTSSLMFRRPAIELMRPHRPLGYKGHADNYLGQGAHALGGSLYLNQPLVYRAVHSSNAFLSDGIFATGQTKGRLDLAGELGKSAKCRADAIDAIRANGGYWHLAKARRSALARWRRSIAKRWHMLIGRSVASNAT